MSNRLTMAGLAEFLSSREKLPTVIMLKDLWIGVGDSDQRAAELMIWMEDQWPDLAPAEFLSVLNSALWWFLLFESMKGAVGVDTN